MKTNAAIIALLFATQVTSGKQATVTADRDSLRLGEPVHLSLHVCHDIGIDSLTVQWPQWSEELIPGVEILQVDTQRTFVPDAANPYLHCQEQVLVVTVWDTGFVALPPFELPTTTGPLQTGPLLLYCTGPDVDPSGTFMDVKPAIPLVYTRTDWLTDNWYFLLAGLLGAGALAWFLLRHKPAPTCEESILETPSALPHIVAFEALTKLQQEQLWQQGKAKLYHSKLNEIFRHYLEGRYQIAALEATTDEIMDAMRGRGLPADIQQAIAPSLRLSDLVKFAKHRPSPTDHQTAWESVHRFVECTRPESSSA